MVMIKLKNVTMTGTCVTWQRKRKRCSLKVEEEELCVNWCVTDPAFWDFLKIDQGFVIVQCSAAVGHQMCSGVHFWNRLYLIFLAGGVRDPGFWDVLKSGCAVEWSEKDQNCKLRFPQPDYWPHHSPDFRTVFGIMIGPFSLYEIGKTWGKNKQGSNQTKTKNSISTLCSEVHFWIRLYLILLAAQ